LPTISACSPSRTNFEDWPELADRRHFLRLWVAAPISRELPPSFESRFGTCEGGKERGGFPPREEAGEPVKNRIEEFRLEKV